MFFFFSLWTTVNLTGQKVTPHLLSTTVQKQPVSSIHILKPWIT